MTSPKSLLTCCAFSVLCGCGVVPSKVSYSVFDPLQKNVSPGNNAPEYVFRQRRSILVIKPDDKDSSKLAIVASPSELTNDDKYSTLYTIQGIDDFKSTTQLKISYVDNTKFVDELSITTKDNIADTISKIGSLVKAIIPITAGVVSGTTVLATPIKPTVIDPSTAKINTWSQDPINKNICFRLRNIAVESTLTIDDYIGMPNPRQSFPVPACATAFLDVAIRNKTLDCNESSMKSETWTSTQTTYAHHSNVLPMPLPSTGSLKMHSICGASITEAVTQDRFQLMTYLTSTLTQAKDAQNAWKEATKKPDAPAQK